MSLTERTIAALLVRADEFWACIFAARSLHEREAYRAEYNRVMFAVKYLRSRLE